MTGIVLAQTADQIADCAGTRLHRLNALLPAAAGLDVQRPAAAAAKAVPAPEPIAVLTANPNPAIRSAAL